MNSSLAWRETFYTRSLDPVEPGVVVNDNLNRQYFTMQAQAVGPVFNRVWNTPDNGYAEKFKHTIEPVFTVQRTSAIDEELASRIVPTDASDYTVGGNDKPELRHQQPLLRQAQGGSRDGERRPGVPDRLALAVLLHEQRGVAVRRQLSDRHRERRRATSRPSGSMSVRSRPSAPRARFARSSTAATSSCVRCPSNSTYSWTGRLQTSVGWTKKFLIENLPGFDNPDALDNYVNLSTNAQTRDNRFGGRYVLYYDILRSTMQQQRFSWFYNAQCCGLGLEYQIYSLGALGSPGASTDRRFFLSFTLAGLGNFSPFNGALNGIPR